MADIFDTTINWLLGQALSDDELSTTILELANRLVDGGVSLARLSIGRSVLHPVIGLLDMQWNRDSREVTSQTVSRAFVRTEIDTDNPFADLSRGKSPTIIADLRDPAQVARYKIFGEFAAKGFTGYAAFARSFGYKQKLYSQISEHFRGASVSFATTRFSGFTASELAGLERLMPALSVCARVDTDRFMTNEVLETYLGRISGKRVLTGQIDRLDVQQIECALFYSDMRGSLALSQQLKAQDYLDTVNAYFDCTANAVMEHGGEVLKFVGDGVMAIFPIEEGRRPRASMCTAALAAAREAFARAEHTNAQRTRDDLPLVTFGIALHVGQVIYGNVGIEKRLDFTATGPAVGLAARIEGLTRQLNRPILASADFANHLTEQGQFHADQRLRSFAQPIPLISYPLVQP